MLACTGDRIASPFPRKNRGERSGNGRSKKLDRSIIPSDLADRESASVQSASIFTLQVCLHWPDKRYLPIIIASLCMCFFVRSFQPARGSPRSMYPVRPILTTRIDAHGRFLGTIPLSVINFVGFADQRIRIDFNPRGKRFNRSR